MYSLSTSTVVKEVYSLLRNIEVGSFSTSLQPSLLAPLTETMLDCPEQPTENRFSGVRQRGGYNQICLVSGGADSTIAWYRAGKPHGIYIDIGQVYAEKEINAIAHLGIQNQIVVMNDYKLVQWKHIIPGRNLLFLTIAAESLVPNGIIHFAMVEGEGADSNKGDKSFSFLNQFIKWYKAVTGKNINIMTLSGNTKPGWLKWFIDEGHDVNIIRHKTVTCFSGEYNQCGTCQACLRKYLSFMYNNIDTAVDYEVHPMVGCAEYVAKYKRNFSTALREKDYSHYSYKRCVEDLESIDKAEMAMKG